MISKVFTQIKDGDWTMSGWMILYRSTKEMIIGSQSFGCLNYIEYYNQLVISNHKV